MKTTKTKLALGVAAALLAAPLLAGASAQAGDYNGGLKGLRGTYVPVPAPAPIPDYKANWYLRGDVGVGFGLGVNASENGMVYGVEDYQGRVASAPFGFGELPFFTNSGTDGNDNVGHSVGVGVGYYFSPNFRMDITGELRMMKSSTLQGTFQYDALNENDPTQRTNETVFGEVTDRTVMRSGIIMANAYVDMNPVGSWKPYIGAGLGFSVNELQRTHSTQISSCTHISGANPTCVDDPAPVNSITASTDTQYTYSLAAAATAGVSYRVSDVTSLDFNYRYLYVGGTDASVVIGGNTSSIEIDDQHEHYLRMGLRWDIN